jgi:hypothetical protein
MVLANGNGGNGGNGSSTYPNITQGRLSAVTINVINNTAPTVVNSAAASVSSGTLSANLSVLGGDATAGQSALIYTWATIGTPPATVNFSANGTNTTASFSTAGSYDCQVTITNPADGLSTASEVSVIIGTAGSDTIRVVRSGANLVVYFNSATATDSVAFAAVGSVTIAGGTGTDSVNIDFSGGSSPVPSGGIAENGSGGVDTLIVTGNSGNDTATINANTISFNTSPITYSAVSSIIINGNGGIDSLTQTVQPGNVASLTFNGNTSGGPSSTDTLNISAGSFALALREVVRELNRFRSRHY